MMSLNNKLILKPYKGERKLKAEVSGGFARVSQKTKLVGLELLATSTVILNGAQITLDKGSVAYFEEEVLYAQDWSKKVFTSDFIDEEFIVADYAHVRVIGQKSE